MTRWCDWRKTFRCATRSLMAKEILAPLTATRRQRCATPRHASRRLQVKCSPTSIMRRSTSHRTTTARKRNRASSPHDSQTCWSTDLRGSPSAWRRTFRHTTSARLPTRQSPSLKILTSPPKSCVRTCRRQTFLLAACSTATTRLRIHSRALLSVSMQCDRCMRTGAVELSLKGQRISKRRRAAIAPPSSSPSFRTR